MIKQLLREPGLSVVDYVCTAGPGDRPYAEVHGRHSLSFVARGSFGCTVGRERHELVAGSVFIGAPGQEYVCTHDHHAGGDVCLSFQYGSDLIDELGGGLDLWQRVAVAPSAALAPIGALAEAAVATGTGLALAEAGMVLGARVVDTVRGRDRSPVRPGRSDARRAVDAALWLSTVASSPVQLAEVAARAGLSPFHFLRTFSRVIGTTPGRYVIACRLHHAALLLRTSTLRVTDIALEVGFEDLSHFHRTFRWAVGLTPAQFRRLTAADRKILQDRLAPARLG